MDSLDITSRDNPLVKHLKALNRLPKYRLETGEFAAEGERLFDEAMRSGLSVTAVLSLPSFAQSRRGDFDRLSAQGARIALTSDYVIGAVSDLDSPPGAVFSAKRPSWPLSGLSGRKFIVLDSVQNPGNVGAILRCADAFGIDGILCRGECADAFSPKTVRAAMGAAFRVPSVKTELPELMAFTRKNGLKLIASALSDNAADIGDMRFDHCAVVIGNEGGGISEEVLSSCDAVFRIPMRGRAQSLNASAAAAIITWEMTK